MNGARTGFKRMVVGLPQGVADQAAVNAAADLAEFLQIELLAAFVADTTHTLAELSGARELRALDLEWQAIDAERITRDIKSAASLARRRFAEIVGGRSIKSTFDVIADAEVIASRIRADDIVAVIEPAHPGERITRQFTGLLKAAFTLAGAVLVVPRRLARTAGPIVAVAVDVDDPAIRVALEIAAALKERLIVMAAAGARLPAPVLADAERLGVQLELFAGGRSPTDVSPLSTISGRLQERLRVLQGGAMTDDAAGLFASLQGIPLLVIDGDRAEAAAERHVDDNR